MISNELREQVKKDLLERVVTVTFTRVRGGNGRVMKATLEPSYIPPVLTPVHNDPAGAKKSGSVTQVVWDVDALGWRSFRWDTITQIDGVNV